MRWSWGHSSPLRVEDVTSGVDPLGATIDDAAGEAFDKCGAVYGLPPFPGDRIDRARVMATASRSTSPCLTVWRDLERHRFGFSFSQGSRPRSPAGSRPASARGAGARQRRRRVLPGGGLRRAHL